VSALHCTCLVEPQRVEFGNGCDVGLPTPTARGIEAVPVDTRCHLGAHSAHKGQEAAVQVGVAWCEDIVRAAAKSDRRGARGHERREHRLEHEARCASRAYRKFVRAGFHRAGLKHQLLRQQIATENFRARDLTRGLHTRQMLPQQARLLAARAQFLDAERLPRDHRQRQRRAQNLTTAFALGAVEDDHDDRPLRKGSGDKRSAGYRFGECSPARHSPEVPSREPGGHAVTRVGSRNQISCDDEG
jgi:hypothetical protein